MINVKNVTPGPRGVNTKIGPVLLQPGEGRDLDMTAEEIAVARETGWFELDGQRLDPTGKSFGTFNGKSPILGPDGKPIQSPGPTDVDQSDQTAPAKTPGQVLAMFDDPNVHFQTAKSEALKVLGPDAPTTKDDIIVALKAKAA